MIHRVIAAALFCLLTQTAAAQFFGGGRWGIGTLAQLPAACRVGDTFFVTNVAPGANLYGCTATNTWTQLSGGSGGASWERQIIAAKCQGTIAGAGLSLPASNAPVPTCSLVQNTNTPAYATLDWDDTGTKSAFDTLLLPLTTLGTISVQVSVSTSGTSTAAQTLQIATACITSGGTADPVYNAAQNISITPDGTIGDPVTVTLASLTLTGCSAQQQLRFRLQRDTADANTNTLRLHWIRFYAN